MENSKEKKLIYVKNKLNICLSQRRRSKNKINAIAFSLPGGNKLFAAPPWVSF